MSAIAERQEGTICPEFDRSISIDFHGGKINSDTGFLLLRQVDERYKILDRVASRIKNPRSPAHTDHSILQLLRQRVYQVEAGMRTAMTPISFGWTQPLDWPSEKRMTLPRASLPSAVLKMSFLQPIRGSKPSKRACPLVPRPFSDVETRRGSSWTSIPPMILSMATRRERLSTATTKSSAITLSFASLIFYSTSKNML